MVSSKLQTAENNPFLFPLSLLPTLLEDYKNCKPPVKAQQLIPKPAPRLIGQGGTGKPPIHNSRQGNK
jgi:hypothetical protein